MPEVSKIVQGKINVQDLADDVELVEKPAAKVQSEQNSKTLKNILGSFTSENELVSLSDESDDNTLISNSDEPNEPSKVNNCSAALPISIIPGIIVDIFDGNTKDGEIGNTQQHSTGDCWVLSTVNSLSYTEEGRKLIKDSLEYHNGYTIVHLKGIGDIKVTDYEVIETKGSSQYSSGDDDMIIFELAMEKALDMIARGEIKLDKPLDANVNDREATTAGNSSAEGGLMEDAYYMLTGVQGKYTFDKDEQQEILDKFQANNGKNLALGFGGLSEDVTIKDVNGKDVTLHGSHAYAVKSVTDTTATLINPWDSSQEIVISKDEFMKLDFCFRWYDLSSEPSDLTMTPTKNKDGNNAYERDCSSWEADGYKGYKSKCVKEVTKYAPDGTLLSAKYLDENGNVVYEREYNKDGNDIKEWSFNSDNSVGMSVTYNEDGSINEVKLYNTYDGNIEDDKNNYAAILFASVGIASSTISTG